MKKIFRFTIKTYQQLVSPWLGRRCRFEPSCSAYFLEAVDKEGVIRGVVMGIRRLLRCHPFSEGGWDPVPQTHCETHEDNVLQKNRVR